MIDDHIPSKTLLVKALQTRDLEVVGEGTSGKEALRLAKATAPDAVLTAVGLQDLDGIGAARKIMEENPLPIVILTSHCDVETIERAKSAGVMAYLLKPLREEELLPTIELTISRFSEFSSLRRANEDLRKTLEIRKAVEQAKGILMKKQGLSEAEAFSLIRKKSMDMRKPMAEIAQVILLAEEMTKRTTV